MYKYVYHENKVIAISSFAGRIVRGIAKCDPADGYVRELGELIAKSRCDIKVAKRRSKHAEKKLTEAKKALAEAKARVSKMEDYVTDAYRIEMEAKQAYDKLMEHI
jgi:phage terminase Nu1 subunit (DNA packaging protein)